MWKLWKHSIFEEQDPSQDQRSWWRSEADVLNEKSKWRLSSLHRGILILPPAIPYLSTDLVQRWTVNEYQRTMDHAISEDLQDSIGKDRSIMTYSHKTNDSKWLSITGGWEETPEPWMCTHQAAYRAWIDWRLTKEHLFQLALLIMPRNIHLMGVFSWSLPTTCKRWPGSHVQIAMCAITASGDMRRNMVNIGRSAAFMQARLLDMLSTGQQGGR